jgi:hypothetical protein
VQWLAPLASEAPECIITSLFAWRLLGVAGLGALVSSKVNQWTLLVGTIPLVFNLASFIIGKPVPQALVRDQVQRVERSGCVQCAGLIVGSSPATWKPDGLDRHISHGQHAECSRPGTRQERLRR